MGKYDALWRHVAAADGAELTLDFAQIARIAGAPIDHSFLRSKRELLACGWEVQKISMKEGWVRFRRLGEEKRGGI